MKLFLRQPLIQHTVQVPGCNGGVGRPLLAFLFDGSRRGVLVVEKIVEINKFLKNIFKNL